jgi:hypothetical protein
MPDIYDIGDDVILTGSFTTLVDGVDTPTDPSTVTCKVRKPDGSEETIAPVHRSTGVYDATFTPTSSGEHWYRFEGTGAAKAAGEEYFTVRRRRVP